MRSVATMAAMACWSSCPSTIPHATGRASDFGRVVLVAPLTGCSNDRVGRQTTESRQLYSFRSCQTPTTEPCSATFGAQRSATLFAMALRVGAAAVLVGCTRAQVEPFYPHYAAARSVQLLDGGDWKFGFIPDAQAVDPTKCAALPSAAALLLLTTRCWAQDQPGGSLPPAHGHHDRALRVRRAGRRGSGPRRARQARPPRHGALLQGDLDTGGQGGPALLRRLLVLLPRLRRRKVHWRAPRQRL